jgi:biopolymer transport protein TolR
VPKVLPASSPSNGNRFGRGRRVSTTLAEINVIPLVDVMLVLLIIVMIAAPMLQRGVEVSLPVSARATNITSERLFVDVPLSFQKDRRVFLAREPVSLDILAERLRQTLLGRTNKQVFLRSDRRLPVQSLIDVLDRLTEGGAQAASIVTDSPRTP